MNKIQDILADVLILIGCALFVIGTAILCPPAAFFVAGALLIALGLILGLPRRGGDGR